MEWDQAATGSWLKLIKKKVMRNDQLWYSSIVTIQIFHNKIYPFKMLFSLFFNFSLEIIYMLKKVASKTRITMDLFSSFSKQN